MRRAATRALAPPPHPQEQSALFQAPQGPGVGRPPAGRPAGVVRAGTHGQGLLVQAIGGSLRLLLLQNGACPFPCTPLLSVLLLVTQTDREVFTLFPGLRSMAMSM
jgi:hypothetical protein